MAAGAQLDKTSPNPGAAGPGSAAADGSGSVPARFTAIRTLAGPFGEYWDKGAARWTELQPRQRSWAIIGVALLAATVAALMTCDPAAPVPDLDV